MPAEPEGGLIELNVDKIFENIIGTDIYKLKALNTSVIPDVPFGNTTQIFQKFRRPERTNTTNKSSQNVQQNATMPNIPKNVSNQYIEYMRMTLRLNEMIKDQRRPITTFDENGIAKASRRFDKLVDQNRTKIAGWKENKRILTRREYYVSFEDDIKRATPKKKKLLGLMEQFIYETRYKLGFSQMLRNKYMKSLFYKLGYLFSLLRTIMNQQMWIHAMMTRYHQHWHTSFDYHFHIKLLETAIRYEIDIKDIVKYIKKINYVRQRHYAPDYPAMIDRPGEIQRPK